MATVLDPGKTGVYPAGFAAFEQSESEPGRHDAAGEDRKDVTLRGRDFAPRFLARRRPPVIMRLPDGTTAGEVRANAGPR